MKFTLKKIVTIFILLFSSLAYAQADTGFSQLLNNLQTVTAQFQQTVLGGKGQVLQQTAGTMALQRPGKFRWETTQPSQQLLIADGKEVWFYDKDLQQVTVQKLQAMNADSPAMLLEGTTDSIIKNFRIIDMPVTSSSQQKFNLLPKNKNSLFKAVELTFINKKLQTMQLIDNLGQQTQVQFSDVKAGVTLSPGLFQFKVPKGVDVVRQ